LFSNGVNNEDFHTKNVLPERSFRGQNNPRMKVSTYLTCRFTISIRVGEKSAIGKRILLGSYSKRELRNEAK